MFYFQKQNDFCNPYGWRLLNHVVECSVDAKIANVIYKKGNDKID